MQPSAVRGAPAALWVYGGVVAVAVPVILLLLGDHRWFHGDEWIYIFDRDLGSVNDLFRPGNAHWSTVPIVQYKLTEAAFGLNAYWPYQLGVVIEHLIVASLMRVIMRRSGVDPWISTAAATAFIFFGAGSINIIWGFQIGFNSALIFGMLQLIAADHRGPIGRRDALGLVAGLLSIMSAGVGITMVATTGLFLVLRRKWIAAAFHTVPLGVIYLMWAAITHPDASSGFGNPTVRFVGEWVADGEVGLFLGLGGFIGIAVLLAAMTAIGALLLWKRPQAEARPALPIAMATGGAMFLVTTCIGRWIFGLDAARGGRFMYVVAALTLPLIALTGTAVARRIGKFGFVAVSIVLLIGIVPGLADFEEPPFDERYYDQQERVIRTLTRVDEATMVPASVLAAPDPLRTRFVQIGDLLEAVDSGELSETTFPLTTEVREEMKVRLGFAVDRASRAGGKPEPCPTRKEPLVLEPDKGDVVRITTRVRVATVDEDGKRLFSGVTFRPDVAFDHTVELDGLKLQFSPPPGGKSYQVCEPT